MFSAIRAWFERLKALLITHAVLDLEADLLTAASERHAALLRQAEQYEKDGLHAVAHTLRQQIELQTADRPLTRESSMPSVLPAESVPPPSLSEIHPASDASSSMPAAEQVPSSNSRIASKKKKA